MPVISTRRIRVRKNKNSPWKDIPVAASKNSGGGSGGVAYEIGYGLSLSDENVLSAEVGKDSFAEIPNTKVQEIFNKAMQEV